MKTLERTTLAIVTLGLAIVALVLYANVPARAASVNAGMDLVGQKITPIE
jgi:hypothetical protein